MRLVHLPRPSACAAACTALLAAACLQPAFAQQPPLVEIRLHDYADAQAAQVLLGDVATIHTGDLPSIAALVALPLGHAPAPGRESVLRREMLVRWVRTQTGRMSADVVWLGADQVVVRGTTALANGASAGPAGALVAKGDWAVLRARSGGIEIEDRVEILQAGALGDVVRVRGSASAASFLAKVTARGQVAPQ